MSMTTQSSVRDKILATPSEMSKVENAPAEMLRDLDQQMEKRADDGCTLWIKLYSKYEYEIRYNPGKENVVIDTLSRKERVKPRRVLAMAMTIQYGVRGMKLVAQNEVFKQENVGSERDEAHASSYHLSIRYAPFEALYGRKCRLPVLWVEIGESSLTGLELVQETIDKIKVDKTLRFVEEPVENSVREVKRLKSSRMVVVKFLFDELRDRVVNDVVTQLKVLTSLLDDGRGSGSWMFLFVWSGYAAMRTLLWAGKIIDSKILVKVRWNSKRGPEFTWEREDYMKSKYPQLFVGRADESTS
ncbi:hypothetical protein Tco_1421172 [Tanacetum coccineum]